ncbi:MAG: hypothetical protein AAGI08_11940, partial [Bacteroidota bacterium]
MADSTHSSDHPRADRLGGGRRWYQNAEMVVALSALVLSLCGISVAIYEASLIRQAQRASVWPNIEVGASLRSESVSLWVNNSGVGPARIQSAALMYEGETLRNWEDLIRTLGLPALGEGMGQSFYQSMISGRVLPPGDPETIFSIDGSQTPELAQTMNQLREAVLDGRADVQVCYCSVYEECWVSSLSKLVSRTTGESIVNPVEPVERCSPEDGS